MTAMPKIIDKIDEWDERHPRLKSALEAAETEAQTEGRTAVAAALSPTITTSEEVDEIDAMLWNLLLRCKRVGGDGVLTQVDVNRFRLLRANLGVTFPW